MSRGLHGPEAYERRAKKRIYVPFPAVVVGLDVDDQEFSVNTVVDNLNDKCLYLRMVPRVEKGAMLIVTFSLSGASDSERASSQVRLQGEVLRADAKPGGACGVAVSFREHKWI